MRKDGVNISLNVIRTQHDDSYQNIKSLIFVTSTKTNVSQNIIKNPFASSREIYNLIYYCLSELINSSFNATTVQLSLPSVKAFPRTFELSSSLAVDNDPLHVAIDGYPDP